MEEARRILGLSPDEDPAAHMAEFAAARNRIAEPEQWLPETPSPIGRPTTPVGKKAQFNWLPVILSIVAVAVLAFAMAALVIEGQRRNAASPPSPVESAR